MPKSPVHTPDGRFVWYKASQGGPCVMVGDAFHSWHEDWDEAHRVGQALVNGEEP